MQGPEARPYDGYGSAYIDLDGDGWGDLWWAGYPDGFGPSNYPLSPWENPGRYGIVIGFNLHDGGFGDEILIPGADVISVAVGDLNQDGKNDLVTYSTDAGLVVRYAK